MRECQGDTDSFLAFFSASFSFKDRAGFPLSHPRARLISATPANPALKVRAFIVCSSFCGFLLLRPFSQCQQGCAGAQAGHGLRTGGNAFAI